MKKITSILCLLFFFCQIITAQTDKKFQSPEPLSPKNGFILNKQDVKKPLVFKWTPLVPKTGEDVIYKVSVIEIRQGQSPSDAMKTSSPIFEKEVTNQTQLIATPGDISTAWAIDKTSSYGWYVQALNTKGKNIGAAERSSGVSTFTLDAQYVIRIDSIKVSCISNSGSYSFVLKITNVNATTAKLTNVAITSSTPSGAVLGTFTPIIGTLILSGASKIITGTLTGTNLTNICIGAEITDATNSFNKASKDTCTAVPYCFCNPCLGKRTTFGAQTTKISNNGAVELAATVTHTPTKLIKVAAEIVDVQRIGAAGCLKCTKESKEFGNYTSGTLNLNAGTILNNTKGYGKQISWDFAVPTLVSAFSYNFQMMFPPLNEVSCCKDSMRLCIRWSFTDEKCNTCDSLVCKTIVRTYVPTGPILTDPDVFNTGISKMTSPYIDWYNQETDAFPQNFDVAVRDLYVREQNDEIDFGSYMDIKKNQFLNIRDLKNNPVPVLAFAGPTPCGNGDFESGIIDPAEWQGGWTTIGATNTTFTAPFNTTIQPANGNPVNAPSNTGCGNQANENHHVIVSVGPDPNVPITRVPVTAAPNNFAVRLGNTCVGNGTERLVKRFTVPSNLTSYRFLYALVFPAPHGLTSNPSLWVRVYNAANVLVPNLVYLNPLTPATPLDRVVSDLTNPFWQNNGGGILYKDWTCARIDLSSLVNQQVTIEIITTDCTAGGHYGYGYFDNFCLGCDGAATGNVTIKPIADSCIKASTQVCVDYTLPKIGATTGSGTITLQFYKGGVAFPYTITSPVLTANGTYCFTIDPTKLPCNTGAVGYDVVATGNFSITVGGVTTTLTVTSPDPVGSPVQGIKPGYNNDLVCCGTLADNCCSNFRKTITAVVTMVGNATSGYNTIKFVPTFTVGPKLIKKVRISVVNFETNSTNKECLICESSASTFGSMYAPQSIFGGGKDAIEGMVYPSAPIVAACFPVPCPTFSSLPSHEIVWGSNSGFGYNLADGIGDQTTTFFVRLPKKSTLACCDDTIKVCVKYSFTDIDCVTCETVVCYTIINRKIGGGIIVANPTGLVKDETNTTVTTVETTTTTAATEATVGNRNTVKSTLTNAVNNNPAKKSAAAIVNKSLNTMRTNKQ